MTGNSLDMGNKICTLFWYENLLKADKLEDQDDEKILQWILETPNVTVDGWNGSDNVWY
jgi:hypothetical protein